MPTARGNGLGVGPAERLRGLLSETQRARKCLLVPACHDAMTAKLIADAGFKVGFMSGYAVSATHIAQPDAGLISYGEMVDVGKKVCDATRASQLCIIGDGDTGFGSSGNIRRAVRGYAAAGLAAISIEDQVYPKRCSYAKRLAVESRSDAVERVRCAVAARDEMRTNEGLDIVIVARTDCRNASAHGGLEEAIARCMAFKDLGAEVVYAEGLQSIQEMRTFNRALVCNTSPCFYTMVAQVEQPGKPLVPLTEARNLGFSLSLMGLTLLNVALKAMTKALAAMAEGRGPSDAERLSFEELYRKVGFEDHYAWEERFGSTEEGGTLESTASGATHTVDASSSSGAAPGAAVAKKRKR